MRFLLLNDIHIGTSKTYDFHSDIVRAASSEAAKTLDTYLPFLNSQEFDAVIQLGDMFMQVQDKVINQQNFESGLQLLEKLDLPKIHLLGNHELRAFSLEQLKLLYQPYFQINNQKHPQLIQDDFFGYQSLGEYHILWLDIKLKENRYPYLTEERIEWLRRTVEDINHSNTSNWPTLIFSHYSLAPLDPSGSFYFHDHPPQMIYKNADEIRDVLDSLTKYLSINAHVHLLTYQSLNQHHFISSPAFSENIASGDPHFNPGIYSVLNLTQDEFIFTSYSREFCYGKIQGRWQSM